ncbi:SpoIIE family protein phosphatase [Alkalihalobacillus pseudalcaliphilus]|uniref:SpoIIE family protein phosphatase n=1 Tax=Alkalihalobacillus pseudalcaliphilus TaxID=79884 RepID=UPI00064DBAF2|nr:SpoIIE family protein phosphatase [Alkalihalobacillus pseudalcaliphilus]KMK76931.1 indirect negative regulator of sigma-B activity [Alkalihalobacillus pseudalcaliphilus]
MISFYEDSRLEIAALQQSKNNMHFCGDAHLVLTEKDFMICAVVDGLGSGEGAHESADIVVKEVEKQKDLKLDDIMVACNEKLHGYRGAVVSLVKIDYLERALYYSNFGNISFVLYYPDGKVIQPIPSRGYLSGRVQKFYLERFPYEEGMTFMLYSDGVKKPPEKNQITKMGKVKEEVPSIFEAATFAQDDVTLLIGKLH